MVNQRAVSSYQQIDVASMVDAASPHRLVQMLMQGFLQRVAEARGALSRNDIAARGVAIGKAMDILMGLKGALNREVASDLPQQLEALYDYMQTRLAEANLHGDATLLEEVASLMRVVKEGWDGIAQEVAATG